MDRQRALTLVATVALAAATAGCASTGGDVTVVNSAQNPLPVRHVDRPGREPFHNTVTLTNTIDATLLNVPVDRRLVIEFVSGFCTTTQSVPVHTVRLSGSVDHFLTPTVFPTGPGTTFAVITQLARIDAAPRTPVKVTVFPTAVTGTTTCSISVSGDLTSP
jgi:hypothetical protein